MTVQRAAATCVLACLVVSGIACDKRYEGAGALHARKVALQREVEGLRESVSGLERNKSLVPADDVGIAIEEGLVRDMIAAQLPFDADVKTYHVLLTRADVAFQQSAVIRLSGTLFARDKPSRRAEVTVIGALEDVAVDETLSTLRASVAVDHITIDKAAGIESVLNRQTLDELGRTVRLELAGKLPTLKIPVQIQQTIDIPSVTAGPVRIEAASLPLRASVSQVVADGGRLWIAVRITPGEFTREARR